jgi:hypothetical protein
MPDNNVYFAAQDSEDTVASLQAKSQEWFQSLDSSGYLDKLRTMWSAYHGAFYEDSGDSHQISFGGEQGELTQLGVNHIRNIAQHMLNMITSTRPMMQARAINTDYRSTVQTKLANGILDYYMRDHRLEEYLKTAAEYSIVLASGYVKMEWNATAGEVYDTDQETGEEIRQGDIDFQNLSPFDVVFDTNREDRKHDWVLTRSFKNRFDLAAKYPELKDKILKLPTKDILQQFSMFSFHFDETDLIPVYEMFHKRTESLPNGRYLLYLDRDVVLLDGPMPYRDLPVYSLAPSYYLGTPFAYTPMFDLLNLQDAVNSLYTTVLSNQTAFGVQSIIVPPNSNISVQALSSGMNIIEVDERNGEVRALNLTQTPKEIFDFIQMLEKVMETVSGVNSVARGNPDPNLRSGNALALVQSMTLQFLSGLQQSYVMLIEDLGTGIINILKDHANIPRMTTIVGRNKRSELKEFVGDDVDAVNRVVVDIGNPLARTTAGRVEMAEQLLQMGLIKTPEEYFNVIETGNIDNMTDSASSQLDLTKAENENMVDNKPIMAVLTDEHVLHIKEHAAVLSDPELRFDPDLVQRVTNHIQEHIQLLQTTDPNILTVLGQQPIQPPQGPPQQPQGPPGQQGPSGPSPDQSIPSSAMNGASQQVMGGAPVASQLDQTGTTPHSLPGLPKVNGALLSNPQAQQSNLGNVK